MDGRKRTVQIKFRVTEAERDLILEKMKLIPTRNMARFLCLLFIFSLSSTIKTGICQTHPQEKKNAIETQRFHSVLSAYSVVHGLYSPSVSTSLISFAVAVTIRIPLSLIVSSNESSCRRCVFFVSGFSKRNWSTDIS